VELSFGAGGLWSYLAVFVAAATPVVEILVVIPAAILAGLPPGPTAAVAVAGNLATVVVVVMAGDRLASWWRRRRPRPDPAPPSRRARRARRLASRWGVAGLALLAPVTTGTHIAALGALALDRDRRRVLAWMGAGIVLWAVAVTVASALGVGFLR
jgi:uncharacterized membrane protein